MPLFTRIRSLVSNLFQRDRIEHDLNAEVNSYLTQLIDEKTAAGLSPGAARRAARIELGGVEQASRRTDRSAMAFFVLLALVLGCVGLYGTMSYFVARQTNEIGIRMALGARPSGVFRMVLNLAAEEGVIFVDQAVLAKTLRAICNEPPQFLADVATYWRRTDERVPWPTSSGVPTACSCPILTSLRSKGRLSFLDGSTLKRAS